MCDLTQLIDIRNKIINKYIALYKLLYYNNKGKLADENQNQ